MKPRYLLAPLLILLNLPAMAQIEGPDTLKVLSYAGKDCETETRGVIMAKGLCYYEKLAGAQNQEDAAEKALNALRKAQQEGLQVRSQSLAALLEGLVYCKTADTTWSRGKLIQLPATDKLPARTVMDNFTVTRFCADRRKAAGAFSDVKWGDMLIEKEGDDKYVDGLIEKMASCQQKVIEKYQDCEQIPSQSKETVKKVASDESAPVMRQYFGCSPEEMVNNKAECEKVGGDAPVSAMLGRKLDRISFVIANNRQFLESLEKKADLSWALYNAYSAEKEEVLALSSQIANTYRVASLLTDDVKRQFETWQNGIVSLETQRKLLESKDSLNAQFNASQYAKVAAELEKTEEQVKKLLVEEPIVAKQFEEVCRFYYCALSSESQKEVTDYLCDGFDSFKNNSVCKGSVSIDFQGVAAKESVKNICSNVITQQGLDISKPIPNAKAAICMGGQMEQQKEVIRDKTFDAILPM